MNDKRSNSESHNKLSPTPWIRCSFVAILLSLLTWWAVGRSLEPSPRWSISFTHSAITLEPKLEDTTGRWLITVERPAPSKRTESNTMNADLVILDTKTGKPAGRLTPRGNFDASFTHWPVKLWNDQLWWFQPALTPREFTLELHGWDFLKDTNSRVVQRWPLAMDEPVHVAFAEGASPRFVIQSTLPWELSLITHGFCGWTMLTNILVQGREKNLEDGITGGIVVFPKDREIALKTESLPLVSTYSLPTTLQEKPVLLASWLLPRLRWNIPVFGPDLSWLAWSDCFISYRNYAQPRGILAFDGRSGKPLELPPSCMPECGHQLCYSLGSSLVIDSDYSLDKMQSQLIQPGRSIELTWPESLEARPWKGKDVQWEAPCHSRAVIVDYNASCIPSPLNMYQVYDWTADSLLHNATATVPENVCILGNDRPSWFVQNQVVFEHSELAKPSWHEFLKDWPRVAAWLSRWIASSDRNVVVLEANSGKLLKQIRDVAIPQRLTSEKQMYLYTLDSKSTSFDENITALEAWALPMVFWSAWWSRVAGLAVFLFTFLFITHRSQVRQHSTTALSANPC